MENNLSENIELTMPVNAAYVSAVRLTASSVSNRLKFDVDEIEDIKSAVSEACAYIIGRADPLLHTCFKIKFNLSPDSIEIIISMPDMEVDDSCENDMALMMIKAMMDDMEIVDNNGKLAIIIAKRHKTS